MEMEMEMEAYLELILLAAWRLKLANKEEAMSSFLSVDLGLLEKDLNTEYCNEDFKKSPLLSKVNSVEFQSASLRRRERPLCKSVVPKAIRVVDLQVPSLY
jgi:hypothetical protein